nr:MAG TPA: hypothetical protein [Caudoviricetes sp.]
MFAYVRLNTYLFAKFFPFFSPFFPLRTLFKKCLKSS